MRSNVGLGGLVVSLLLGAVGCGSVSAKPDAGTVDAAETQGCTANALSCGTDDALYQCNAEGTTKTKIQDCQYGCTGDRCNECESNTTFCSADDLVQCDGTGTISNPQECNHGCQMNRCNTCTPQSKYCESGNAVTCGANGEPASTQTCGAAGCLSGVCNTCTPNTTTCQGDSLVVCNAQGTVQSATTCALGCGTTPNAHCKALTPMYGIPSPSGSPPDLLIDANSTLDITGCTTLNVQLTKGTVSAAVPTQQIAVVNQSGGPPICVVKYGKITIDAGFTLTVVNDAAGGHALSLQAVNDLEISGTVVFANAAPGPSPGGNALTYGLNANNDNRAAGGGGAGAAFAGGYGGNHDRDGGVIDDPGGTRGAAVTTIMTRLTAGSAGGNVTNGGAVIGGGGRGGGALHLLSLTRVLMGATGTINLNAQGGYGTGSSITNRDLPAGGGGSGGTLVVEAPAVSVSMGAIAAANGGGGGGGCYSCEFGFCSNHNGQPGQLSVQRAGGGNCSGLGFLGDGGFEADGTTGSDGSPSDQGGVTVAGGGGGGSRGFMILRGRMVSAVMVAAGAIVSPSPTVSAVVAN